MPGTRSGEFAGGYYSEQAAASILGVGLNRLREVAASAGFTTKRSNGALLYSKQDVRSYRDTRPRTAEEALFDAAFNGRAESRAEQESMARDNGHTVTREHAPRSRGETHMSRMTCTCGWFTPWMVGSLATDEKRKHLKEAAIKASNPR